MKSSTKISHLITALFKGQFQGRAWAKREGLENLSITGSSIADVIEKLKSAANAEVKRRSMTLRETLPQRHRQFLEKRDIEYKGFGPITRLHRSSHCYNCKNIVDNEFDFECIVLWLDCMQRMCSMWVWLLVSCPPTHPSSGTR